MVFKCDHKVVVLSQRKDRRECMGQVRGYEKASQDDVGVVMSQGSKDLLTIHTFMDNWRFSSDKEGLKAAT